MADLVVTSFNVHWGGLRPTRPAVPYDLEAVSAALDGDIRLFQEVASGRSALFVPDGFSRLDVPFATSVRPEALGAPSEPPADWGVAVLCRWPLRFVADLVMPQFGEPLGRCRRAALIEVDHPHEPVSLVAVHLSSKVPFAPARQLLALRSQLPDAPAVFAGDTNFWGWGVKALLPGWRRAVRGRTWPAHRPHSQIDNILVRGLRPVGGLVLAESGSDHRAVRAALDWL